MKAVSRKKKMIHHRKRAGSAMGGCCAMCKKSCKRAGSMIGGCCAMCRKKKRTAGSILGGARAKAIVFETGQDRFVVPASSKACGPHTRKIIISLPKCFKTIACPAGKIRNPASNRCIKQENIRMRVGRAERLRRANRPPTPLPEDAVLIDFAPLEAERLADEERERAAEEARQAAAAARRAAQAERSAAARARKLAAAAERERERMGLDQGAAAVEEPRRTRRQARAATPQPAARRWDPVEAYNRAARQEVIDLLTKPDSPSSFEGFNDDGGVDPPRRSSRKRLGKK